MGKKAFGKIGKKQWGICTLGLPTANLAFDNIHHKHGLAIGKLCLVNTYIEENKGLVEESSVLIE